jgi:predicted DNA-binding protein with PD1-like motif
VIFFDCHRTSLTLSEQHKVMLTQNFVAFRLHNGDDLKKSINLRAERDQAFVISCCVGCLYEANIRLAGGETFLKVRQLIFSFILTRCS